MRVLFITNIPSPYRVDFFNELGKQCELDVIFEKKRSTNRDINWGKEEFLNFTPIFLDGKSFSPDMAISLKIIKYLTKGSYDKIIVCDIASPTGILAIQCMKQRKIPYYIEGDGAFPISGSGYKYRLKKHLFKDACGYFSTSELHDAYYTMHGVDKNKIIRYPFSSLYKSDIICNPLDIHLKESLRDVLGITEKRIVISVSRFIQGKGIDDLLKSFNDFDKSVGLYIIGGTPTREYLEIIENYDNKDNIHFLSFMQKEELFKYLKAADVFILPTMKDVWGLVINEAMACGLPIITTTMCGAGTELVKNEYNGFLLAPGDCKTLNTKIHELVENIEFCNTMAKHSLEIIREYTIENMVQKHMEVIEA